MKKILVFVSLLAGSLAANAQNLSVDNLQVNGVATLATPLAVSSGGTGAAVATDASNHLQYLQGSAGSAARSLTSKLSEVVTQYDFGAVCDGTTDDTAALQAWLNALSPTVSGHLARGNCRFVQPLTKSGNAITIRGDGYASILTYAGASTTTDLIVFGDGTNPQSNWSLSGFRVASATQMQQGAALHLRRFSDSFLRDVIADGMDGNRNLWKGFWFDGAHEVWLDGFGVETQWDGIEVNGYDDASNADLYLSNGYSNFNGAAGIRVGGGFGGLFIGNNIEILGNVYAGLSIDNTINQQTNREIIVSDGVAFDGLRKYTQNDILVDSSNSGSGQLLIDAFIGSALQNGVYIKSFPGGTVSIGSAEIFNNLGDGIRIEDPSVRLSLASHTVIQSNTNGYGVDATVVMNNEITGEPVLAGNGSGNWSPNAHRAPAALATASGWTSAATVVKKLKRNLIQGHISQASGPVAQFAGVATVPAGYLPGTNVPIVVVYSGGSSGDGMVPGRLNFGSGGGTGCNSGSTGDGCIEILQPIAGAVNLEFVGEWDSP